MVDEFQKKLVPLTLRRSLQCRLSGWKLWHCMFSALKVPEPVDTQSAKIDAQEQEAAKNTAEYVQASKARIVQYEQHLQKLKSMIPFEQMTNEDMAEAFPETKLDMEKNPFWPHRPIADL
uniref:ATP synthase peripheral stalk subunit d n=1 Tax=Cairina moschata TaxID=8855 RepID=A0A8C3GN05_CAIMO